MLLKTLFDYVTQLIVDMPAATRLVVVFDPYADLDLEETLYVEDSDRTWRVIRYDGNDLAFRKQTASGLSPSDLIWVTAPPGTILGQAVQIELRTMMDVWRRAETFIDASLPGVLRQMAPNETWPTEPVWRHADILSHNLDSVIAGVRTLRRWLPRHAALDANIVRALALHCLQPDLPVHRFLFREDAPAAVLRTYLDLLWGADWQQEGLNLLQTQAREAPHLNLEEIEAWLISSPSAIALYLYLRRWLGRVHIPNIANQMRGLALLDVDPHLLEAHVGSILGQWDRDPAWSKRVIRQAEGVLAQDDLDRVTSLLDLDTPEGVLQACAQADAPAAICTLQASFLAQAIVTKHAYRYTPLWVKHRPAALDNPPETPYTEKAVTLGHILDEIAAIDVRRHLQPPDHPGIADLLDWYIQNGIHDLEYAHARARTLVLHLPDEPLRDGLGRYLDLLRTKIRSYLDAIDHTLAGLISADFGAYLSHSRLSTNLLWDTVKRRRLRPNRESRLWVVVFDGMRWDTWARHVKPRLLETFEVVEDEKAYLSLLPSWTGIARTGLLAGKPPVAWKSYQNRFTWDQAQLACRLFDIPQRERHRQLQFFSGTESDKQYGRLDANARCPYNVLVYNISDDNLHSTKGSLVDLNKVVNSLLDNILRQLNNLIEAGDTLVIASDHGFVELHEEDAVSVPDDSRWERYRAGAPHPVRYRYITSHQVPDDLTEVYKVEYSGLREEYTVAIGHRWFKRKGSRGGHDRYAHGGLSMAEMVIPGAVLKRITEKQMKPVISVQPTKLEMTEDETATLTLAVTNKGNVPVSGELAAHADTADQPDVYSIDLGPGEEYRVQHEVSAHCRTRPDGTIESTQVVKVTFSYLDLTGKPRKKSRRVPVSVQPRTDVVEIDFGGLPDIDI